MGLTSGGKVLPSLTIDEIGLIYYLLFSIWNISQMLESGVYNYVARLIDDGNFISAVR